MPAYCLKCKTQTESLNETQTTSPSGKTMIKSKCAVCGGNKSMFTKSQKGAGIETSKFAKEAYKGKNQRAERIDDYVYDKSKSGRNIAVYKNDKGEAVVSNRGTDLGRKQTILKDLRDDALIAIGKAGKIPRIRTTVKRNEELQSEGYKVTNVGHSLGGRIASETAKRTGNKAEVYAPGTSPFDRQRSTTDGVTSYRTALDPVSANTPRLGVEDKVVKQTRVNPHTLENFLDQVGNGYPRNPTIK